MTANTPFRALGIDHGTKRLGLAYGDEIGVATPLPAILDEDQEHRMAAIGGLVKRRHITDLVLGLPLNMDGSAGRQAALVGAFGQKLSEAFGLPVHLVDEGLTSHTAESTLPLKDLRRARAAGVIDSRAAALILQDWLDRRIPVVPPEAEE